MSAKKYKEGQPREGSVRRRKLEFDVVVRQVKKDKQRFINRLSARVAHQASGCVEYRGGMDQKGYPKISFRFEGRHLMIAAHRVFMIMMTCKPIPIGMEVDHECRNRRCVRHLRLVHYRDNAADVKKAEDCPF